MSTNSKRKNRNRLITTIVVLVACFVAGYAGVYFLANRTAGVPAGPQLVNTKYNYAGITYDMLFFPGSRNENANNISALTQGGKRPLANPMTVLESPVLQNGTGVDMFILPATGGALLPHNACSDKAGLTALYQVPMAHSAAPAIVCSFAPPGKFQGSYLFQFTQGKTTYDGYFQLTYNYDLVMATTESAKKFAQTAGLDKFESEIKSIIASIAIPSS